MRRLNLVSDQYFEKGKHPFVTELIDIITPDTSNSMNSRSKSMQGDQIKEMARSKSFVYDLDLSQICVVMEFVETDFD